MMMLMIVEEDGELREPIRPVRLYWPYGLWVAAFGEVVKFNLTVARCSQTLGLLHTQLIACALEGQR